MSGEHFRLIVHLLVQSRNGQWSVPHHRASPLYALRNEQVLSALYAPSVTVELPH